MDMTTIFTTGSDEFNEYVSKHTVGDVWQAGVNTWTITEVNIQDNQPPSPFDGSAQTSVTLKLDDGAPVLPPPSPPLK